MTDNGAIEIRRASIDDIAVIGSMRLAFIADLQRCDVAALGDPFREATRAFVETTHIDGTMRSWLADDGDGRCVGAVSVLHHDVPPHPEHPGTVEGFIVNMYVAPDVRRAGVGRALLDVCVTEARATGLRRLVLHATDAGRPMYEQAGFHTDSTWMQLPLHGD